jgi:hypothetical protein
MKAGRAEGPLTQQPDADQADLLSFRRGVEEMDLPSQGVGCDILPIDDLFWGSVGGSGLNEKKEFTLKSLYSRIQSFPRPETP